MITSNIIKHYKLYELDCIKKHQLETNNLTFHWNNVPEDFLIESGFLTDKYKQRMKRKLSYEKDGISYNLLGEYGLDGMSKEVCDGKIIYHGIQCKYWKTTVPLIKLNTFIDVVDNRFFLKNNESKGYLYCRKGISECTKKYFEEKKYYETINFDIDYENIMENNNDNYDYSWNNNHILKDYQSEAIEKLLEDSNWKGVKSLIMPCGTGKTVVFCNFLKKRRYKNIFIFSPLKIHSKQNLERIKSYLPNYDFLLINSDIEGIRDIEKIKNKFDENKNCIYSSTYCSAKDLFKELFIELFNENDKEEYLIQKKFDLNNSILIIDEAHNIINEKILINIVKYFPRTLLVTATPPQELEELVNSKIIFNYSLNEAIKNENICDYEIFLPLIEYNNNISSILINIPDELNGLDNDLLKKGLFLINGMLKTGSRRCIVYLKSIDECLRFEDILKNIMKKYHYIKIYIFQITSNTKEKERINYLKFFQENNEYYFINGHKIYIDEIKILLSVRILDEGVDIPKCDSIFISYLGINTNDIRIVQRICRANRLDVDNLNKKANCFIWTDDYNNIIENLQILKNNDINFSLKIKMISSNYDDNINDKKSIKKINKLNQEFKQFINVKCLTYEELWELKKNELFEYVNNNNKIPNENSKLYIWFYSQLIKLKDKNDKIYLIFSLNEIVKSFMDDLFMKNNLYNYINTLTFDEYKELLFEYFENINENDIVDKKYKNIELKKWFLIQKQKIKNNEIEIYNKLCLNNKVKKNIDNYLEQNNNQKEDKSKICEYCNFKLINNFTLKRHMLKCSYNPKIIIENYNNLKLKLKSSSNNIISFYDKFNVDHIDKNIQNELLLSINYEFIIIEIFKNSLNFNFYINKDNNTGFIYKDEKENIVEVDTNIIYNNIMKGVRNFLLECLDNIKFVKPPIDEDILDLLLIRINKIYDNFIFEKNYEFKIQIINLINDISNKNLEKTKKIFEEIIKYN